MYDVTTGVTFKNSQIMMTSCLMMRNITQRVLTS